MVEIRLFDAFCNPMELRPLHDAPLTALVDTGASISGVYFSLYRSMGLRTIRDIPAIGIGGEQNCPASLVRLALVKQAEAINDVNGFYILPDDVTVAAIQNHGSFDMILGMDVIRTLGLTIERSGSFRLG